MQYKSRYEGDLVAKCYFAKHKLVWEVLDGGLKNKIEIQWSDIVAIKANFSSEGPETLDVVVLLHILHVFTSSLAYNLSYYVDELMEGLFVGLCCSWLGSPFSLGRQIHNLGNILYGRQHLILLVHKQAYTGTLLTLF